MIRIDRDIRIAQEHLQSRPPLPGIFERLRERLAGEQSLPFELSPDPLEEGIDSRLAVGQPMQSLRFPQQLAVANILFDLVERSDLLQRFAHPLGRIQPRRTRAGNEPKIERESCPLSSHIPGQPRSRR